jgi:hypothetical protein
MLKLYTDESPGLKVDPFVVMVLSIGFIISVVALHSEYYLPYVTSLPDRFDWRTCIQSKQSGILQRNVR